MDDKSVTLARKEKVFKHFLSKLLSYNTRSPEECNSLAQKYVNECVNYHPDDKNDFYLAAKKCYERLPSIDSNIYISFIESIHTRIRKLRADNDPHLTLEQKYKIDQFIGFLHQKSGPSLNFPEDVVNRHLIMEEINKQVYKFDELFQKIENTKSKTIRRLSRHVSKEQDEQVNYTKSSMSSFLQKVESLEKSNKKMLILMSSQLLNLHLPTESSDECSKNDPLNIPEAYFQPIPSYNEIPINNFQISNESAKELEDIFKSFQSILLFSICTDHTLIEDSTHFEFILECKLKLPGKDHCPIIMCEFPHHHLPTSFHLREGSAIYPPQIRASWDQTIKNFLSEQKNPTFKFCLEQIINSISQL